LGVDTRAAIHIRIIVTPSAQQSLDENAGALLD
jgi:hypothetical protein